ncbi:hypothetical protein MMC21_002509 [Puttea exsequens]|nr:hypothetical protein [Puttea exsequens]
MEFIEGPFNSSKKDDKGTKIGRSPFVPTTFGEWMEHCRLFKEDRIKEHKASIEVFKKETERDPLLPGPGPKVQIQSAFEGKVFDGSESFDYGKLFNGGEILNGKLHKGRANRSTVLGQWTVFSPWYRSDFRPEPAWPCAAEMAEEGDERYTSNFRRMTCVPRMPTNDTINYKQRPFMDPMALDATWGARSRIPTKDSVEEIERRAREFKNEEEKAEAYLGRELMIFLDCNDEIE